MTTSQPVDPTRAGNHFFSNYPAYSFWDAEQLPEVQRVLATAPEVEKPLILYIHIPFCRQRCEFCFFKVYTGKSSSEVRFYLDALLAELEAAARAPYLAGRCPDYVYFGGGTPSYLSSDQLSELFGAIQTHMGWDGVKEVAFECEPGTVKEGKLQRLRDLGVTRLSLGVEHYDDEVLEIAGRAHRQNEIYAAFEAARKAGFPQINIDLISGMVGETEQGWQDCIDRTLALNPDSITVYQMEVPHNTTIYRKMQEGSEELAPVADWETKRRWVDEAFQALSMVASRWGAPIRCTGASRPASFTAIHSGTGRTCWALACPPSLILEGYTCRTTPTWRLTSSQPLLARRRIGGPTPWTPKSAGAGCSYSR